jgi:hypothetical protein
MRQAWKSPTILRLKKIEAWYKNKMERAKLGSDRANAFRAIERYVAIAVRAQSPLGMVFAFSDHD